MSLVFFQSSICAFFKNENSTITANFMTVFQVQIREKLSTLLENYSFNYSNRNLLRSTNDFIIKCTKKCIKNWAFIVKERNLMFYLKYCPSYCYSCVWHKSWSNNTSNSASSYTFGLPLRSLSSMSNSSFTETNSSVKFIELFNSWGYRHLRNRVLQNW